jgi:hypothetical protein
MGQTESSNVSSINTTVATAISNNLRQHTSNVVDQSQEISFDEVSGNVSNINMSMVLTMNTAAALSQQNIEKMKNDVMQELKSQSDAQNIALMGGNMTANNTSLIKTVLDTNITSNTVSQIINTAKQSQKITIKKVSASGNVSNINLGMTADSIAKASMDIVQQADLGNKLSGSAESHAKAKAENPLSQLIDSIGGVVSGLFTGVFAGLMLPFVLVIVFISVIVLVIKLLRSTGSSSSPYSQYPQYQYPQNPYAQYAQ